MKPGTECDACLRQLVEKTVNLSKGDTALKNSCVGIIAQLWGTGITPHEIANRIMEHITKETGDLDPYYSIKEEELRDAEKTIERLGKEFPYTFEGVLKFSALGNSTDFFLPGGYDISVFNFVGNAGEIEEEIRNGSKEALILSDNPGEFLLDLRLIDFLKGMDQRVWYAVKERPVMNDLSMADVERFGFNKMGVNVISANTTRIGMNREDIKGKVQELWESDAVVIAKGMSNYVTMSEYQGERPVVHIMKAKCKPVAEAIGKPEGSYVALLIR